VTSRGLFDAVLAEPRHQVLAALAALLERGSLEEISRVLKVRGALLDLAHESTRRLVAGTAPTLPTWQRYQGVVWANLNPATLNDEIRGRILVPSGLYGLSGGLDELADYRLTMKVALAGVGNIASFWRSAVTRSLEDLGGETFVSFLPKEHASVIARAPELTKRVIEVSFLRHGGAGVAGHDAKAVKGVAARRVLENGIGAIEGFRWKGWRGRRTEWGYEIRAPRGT
jgi:cytoplasmic iron level regulating protein YaaA (DUF328/UPF0246 family)